MPLIEDGIKVLKEIPDLKDGIIINSKNTENGKDFVLTIQGLWVFKNYAACESNTLSTYYSYDSKTDETKEFPSSFLDKRIILSAISPCSSKSAYLFQDEDCCFLNVVEGQQTSTLNLKDEDLHGKVYKDDVLSSFCWSFNSTSIAFVAEKKRPKPSSYMSKTSESNKDGWGKKYSYINDWGEQLTGYCQSVIVVVDTFTMKAKVLDLPDNICGGQVVWTSDSTLLGVGYNVLPFKLGLKYCLNRESSLFTLDVLGNYEEFEKGMHVQSPRVSPDGEYLAFLRGPVGGPHVRAAQLCLMKWKTKEVDVLIDYVPKHIKLNDDHMFYGVSGATSLPLRCWSNNSQEIVFTTPDNFYSRTYVLNIETKEIRVVPLVGSLTAHDVKDNIILASFSTLTQPPRFAIIPVTPENLSHSILISRDNCVEGIPKEWQDQWTFVNPNPHPVKSVSDSPIPVIYFGPTKPSAELTSKRPLIVLPHGGPHSVSLNRFTPSISFFVRLGYSIVIPNYRGSLGQGKDALESLPGNVGKVDVDDVYLAAMQCLEKFEAVVDKNKVFLYGGSHGGFLVTHLSAQYPDLVKAVSTRNPVIDIATMTTSTDIIDWNFVESGDTYEKGKSLKAERLMEMFTKSPLSIIDNVRSPTLLLLGTEDRRVPMSQGLYYYKMLLAKNIPTKLHVYDDCHALSKPDIEADTLLQTILWFDSHSS